VSATAPDRPSSPQSADRVSAAARYGLRRTSFSRGARVLWLIPVWLILVPIVKLLELFGRWPGAVSRRMRTMMQQAPDYTPTAHDVIVGSYFKSGTNWTMQIVTQIAYRGQAEFDHIHDIVPWLELPERVRYTVPVSDEGGWRQAPTGLRAVKTHLPFDRLSYSPEARYLWVVRDPKDVFVSSYRFVRSIMLGPLMPSVRHWLDLFVSDDAMTGSWAEHLAGGWRERGRDNVLFLTYEEMRSDLAGTVARIARFMGVELTRLELERVVERSSYAWMKAHSRQFDTRGLSPPWARPDGAMVRRGRAGGAAELLSAAERQRIDDYSRAELTRLGCDFPYEASFSASE
jgi:hypothetical protein